MPRSSTGKDFIEMLASGTLKAPLVLTGIVKPAEKDPTVLLFTEGACGQSWIKIPVEMIETVEHLTTVTCRDHDHPFVALHLKEPSAENTIAVAFADILRKSRQGIGLPTKWPGVPGGALFARLGETGPTFPGVVHGCVLVPRIICYPVPYPPPGPGEPPYPANPGDRLECVTVFVPIFW